VSGFSPQRWLKVRIAACGVGFLVLFAAIGTRAFDLQIRDRERYKTLAEEQYLRDIELPPRRGRILDRNGAELASTADVESVYINPRTVSDTRRTAADLARALGLDRADVQKKLESRRYFTWLKRRVTPDEAAAVRKLGLSGLGLVHEPRRFYPNRSLAATVMGHAGSDGTGLDGVELAMDAALRGKPSSVQGVRDALGRDVLLDGAIDETASAGQDVVLTLDRYLSFITERALGEALDKHGAKGVMAVVLDARTGDVLAMASAPTYDPNDPGNAAARGARNRTITDAYEPGSTMKVFTIAAALDAGVVRPDDRFDCMMGAMKVGKYTIHDTHPQGILTVADIFKHSSNIGTTRIARRLGRERLAEAFARFGFGKPTGVRLPGERGGYVRPVERWGEIGFANAAFGQGLTVTPLQLAAGVSVVASGGLYRTPRVVARVVHADGRSEPQPVVPERRVLSEKAARMMVTIMKGVTEEGGTAKAAAIEGYPVAGKTGTAQKVSNGRYDPTKWVASFVGFAPADDPRVVVAVTVDEPKGVHLGGAVAAPIFKSIMEQALRYLHVPPQLPPASAATAGKPARASGDEVGEGADEAPGSDVALGTDDDDEADGSDEEGVGDDAVMVPSVIGLSVSEALRVARTSGLEMVVEGSGFATRQRPEPGPAPRGLTLRVTFGAEAGD